MQVTLSNVTFSYPGTSVAVLDSISAVFPEGWTGIVGNNGCGKSTLARIAAGLLAAFPGALLLVSHDEGLLQKATTTRWRLQRCSDADACQVVST